MVELAKRYDKIDEEFLSLFEKRPIVFIEDGRDLQADCQCFLTNSDLQKEEASQANASTVEGTMEGEEKLSAAVAQSTYGGKTGWRVQRLTSRLLTHYPAESSLKDTLAAKNRYKQEEMSQPAALSRQSAPNWKH